MLQLQPSFVNRVKSNLGPGPKQEMKFYCVHSFALNEVVPLKPVFLVYEMCGSVFLFFKVSFLAWRGS